MASRQLPYRKTAYHLPSHSSRELEPEFFFRVERTSANHLLGVWVVKNRASVLAHLMALLALWYRGGISPPPKLSSSLGCYQRLIPHERIEPPGKTFLKVSGALCANCERKSARGVFSGSEDEPRLHHPRWDATRG